MSWPSTPGIVVKFRPDGPWRFGPASGARDRVDILYHSDSLYSALTASMALLGLMEDWLDATARNPNGSAVRVSSLFPFQNEIGYVVPPRNVWPPPASSKVRWKGARFIPLGLVEPLLRGHPLEEDNWAVDGVSECLVPAGRSGPFHFGARSAAAVDRLNHGIEPHSTACLEFSAGAGFWAVVSFADEDSRARWADPMRGALRLLADSGLGGKRSRGWGRSAPPEFVEGLLPGMILAMDPAAEPSAPSAFWLLSLFIPAAGEPIDWRGGNYRTIVRGGRVESPARSGDLKKLVNAVAEGSVLFAPDTPRGAAPDVAPDGFPHPVYRSGFALSIPVPWQAPS